MNHKILTYDDLFISISELPDGDESFRQETAKVLDETRNFLRPQLCWFVQRELPDFQMGRIIERQLRGSEAYAFFICTAGKEFQSYQDRLMAEGDMVRVYIADQLGSLIAEKCADRMEEFLQTSIDKLQWKHTNRFSPGYCGWHVSQQQILFPLFDNAKFPFPSFDDSLLSQKTSEIPDIHNNPCGVQLTSSSLMLPIKSVSGIIGLGPEVRHLDYTCGLCDLKSCYKRKRKATTTNH